MTTINTAEILTKNGIEFIQTETPDIYLFPFEGNDVRTIEKELNKFGLLSETCYGDFQISGELDKNAYFIRKVWPVERSKIIYTTDVSIYEHSNFVAFQRAGKEEITAFVIERYESDKVYITYVQLPKTVSETFLSELDLKNLNNTCDSQYTYTGIMEPAESAAFISDAAGYFGSDNFGIYFELSVDDEQKSDEFYTWLVALGLTKPQY